MNARASDGQPDGLLRIRLQPRHRYVEMAAKYHGLIADRSLVPLPMVDVREPTEVLLARAEKLITEIRALQAKP